MFTLPRVGLLFPVFMFGTLSNTFANGGTLIIYMHDDAGLPSRALQQCISRFESVLLSAGAAPEIRVCDRENQSFCPPPPNNTRVVDLRILPGLPMNMKNRGRAPLGHSIADEGGGVYATVFLESVQWQASAADVPWTVLLAYAAAHEVGHLLLGSNAHTSQGVMKGTWDAKDMRAMFQNAIHFNPEQRRRIAECSVSREIEVAKLR